MSLLLDALKKAEKAKEEAQRQAEKARAGAAAPERETNVAEETPHRPVRTRDQLPDISESIEIQSGVAENDRVVVQGQRSLKHGSPIKILDRMEFEDTSAAKES